jgi:FAD/FMN-containing dehydrogenase
MAATTTLEPEAVEVLRARIHGDVLVPGDAPYDDARTVWNGMIDRRPAAVVRCTGVADVKTAIAFAREHGVGISARGGGHNVAGTAVADGAVVVDLGRMRGVTVDLDRGTVRAGGGARLGDVDHETQAFGLATPFGVVSRTGVAGLTLHGGMGFLTRRFGLSCDSLVAADVVTADGTLVHTDEDRHPDLLWALRGGGGNFGVVTSLEYRLYPVGPEVFMVVTLYPPEAAAEGLAAFGAFMAAAPEEVSALAIYWSAPHEEPVPPEWQGRPVFVLAGCWSGPLEGAEDAVRPLRELAEPVVDMSGPMPYVMAQQLFDPEYPDGRRYYWKSAYLPSVDTAADLLDRYARERPSPLSSIDVWALGGAMRTEPAGGSAFAKRDVPFLLGIEANWDAATDDEPNLAWARALFAEATAGTGAATYLNFPGFVEEGEELLRASYGDAYERLQRVKAAYDPDNVFRSNLNNPGQTMIGTVPPSALQAAPVT